MTDHQQNIADTLEIMHIMDSTVEYGDCILWTGAVGDTGHPIYKKTGCGCKLVRREMFALTKGELIPRQPIDTKCNEKLCINPANIFQSTIQEVAKKAGKRGAFSSKSRCFKIAKSRRSTAKLTIEIAREIRLSTESGPALGKRYGVDKTVINNIKAGKSWKDYASPFAGLMSA